VARVKSVIFALTVPNRTIVFLPIVVEACQFGFIVIAINGSEAR